MTFAMFLNIIGVIGFILWLPSIYKWIISFWYMRSAKLYGLWERGHLSIDMMKIVNEFIAQKKIGFFQLRNSLNIRNWDVPIAIRISGTNEYDQNSIMRYATSAEKHALHQLSSLNLIKFDKGGSISYVDKDDELYYGSAFITDRFKAIFHLWI